MECRSCGFAELLEVLDLGKSPWCNDFRLPGEEAPVFPLNLVYCPACSLLQIDHTVPKEVMFSEHTYVSGTTKTLTLHFKELAEENVRQFNLHNGDVIVDIGGNDGTQLLQYKSLGFDNLINVESASNIAEISSRNGIRTVNKFFNQESAALIASTYGQAKLINASGVFFHLEELHSVLKGIGHLLAEDGVFIIQFMYAKDIIENCTFDGIYHEHLCYYTLTSLANLLKPYGLGIVDAHHSPIHGGSMMAKVVRVRSPLNVLTHRYWELNQRESTLTYASYLDFARKCRSKKEGIHKGLVELKNAGNRIYGYGSPAKGTTLLSFCGIDDSILTKLVEVNELKIGRIAPGSHIPIEKESKDDLPDFYFLLSWNFAEEIIDKNRDILLKGVKFIVPLPEFRIIDASRSSRS